SDVDRAEDSALDLEAVSGPRARQVDADHRSDAPVGKRRADLAENLDLSHHLHFTHFYARLDPGFLEDRAGGVGIELELGLALHAIGRPPPVAVDDPDALLVVLLGPLFGSRLLDILALLNLFDLGDLDALVGSSRREAAEGEGESQADSEEKEETRLHCSLFRRSHACAASYSGTARIPAMAYQNARPARPPPIASGTGRSRKRRPAAAPPSKGWSHRVRRHQRQCGGRSLIPWPMTARTHPTATRGARSSRLMKAAAPSCRTPSSPSPTASRGQRIR